MTNRICFRINLSLQISNLEMQYEQLIGYKIPKITLWPPQVISLSLSYTLSVSLNVERDTRFTFTLFRMLRK